MGEWYEYYLRFKDKDKNLLQRAKMDGLVEIVPPEQLPNGRMGSHYMRMNLQEICAEMFPDGYRLTREEGETPLMTPSFSAPESYTNGNEIHYFNKWFRDERLAVAFSKHYPDDILEEERMFTTGYERGIFYRKNGELCDGRGHPVFDMIIGLNQKLLREAENGKYKVSIPFLDRDTGRTRWGSIYVNKEAVTYFTSNEPGREDVKYCITVMITNEEQTVYFRGEKVQKSAKEITEAYYDSISDYATKAQRAVVLEHFPIETLQRKEDLQMGSEFFVAEIPCPEEISLDGKLSVAISEYNVDNENNAITIGTAGRARNVYVIGTDGRKTKTEIRCSEIEKYWEAELERQGILPPEEQTVQENEEEEEGEEMER